MILLSHKEQTLFMEKKRFVAKEEKKDLTSDLSFTIMSERKVT